MEQTIQFTYMDSPMEFVTNEKVFSPKNVDLGTMAMLSQVLFSPDDKVLDLGCGYGVVGITAAKMVGGGATLRCAIYQKMQFGWRNEILC